MEKTPNWTLPSEDHSMHIDSVRSGISGAQQNVSLRQTSTSISPSGCPNEDDYQSSSGFKRDASHSLNGIERHTGVGHQSSNISSKDGSQNPTNSRSSEMHQTSSQEPVQLTRTTAGKSPAALAQNKASAIHLLECWPREREHFIWIQGKAEVFCTFGSFNLLLVLIVMGYLITGRPKFFFILPWIVTVMGSILLLGALALDFVQSQTLCFYTSPVLFLLAFLSWFIPSLSCHSSPIPGSDHGFSETTGLLVSISLPWLLSAAPIMAWQAACFLSLVMPFLFLATCVTRITATKLSMDVMAILPIVILLTTTNVLLWYLRSLKASRILGLIDTLANAFLASKEHEEQAHAALEERERDNADRISKMRHFISYIFHEIRVKMCCYDTWMCVQFHSMRSCWALGISWLLT